MIRIDEIWAFTSVDPADDTEGIVSVQVGDMHMPLVGADPRRVSSLLPHAERIAKVTGRPVVLKRFTSMSIVQEIKP